MVDEKPKPEPERATTIELLIAVHLTAKFELEKSERVALEWMLRGFAKRPDLELELESLKKAHRDQRFMLDGFGIIFSEEDIVVAWDFAIKNKLVIAVPVEEPTWPDEITESWKL